MAENSYSRKYLYNYAKLCDTVDLYDEMAQAMLQRAKLDDELDEDERNYFSIAFKQVVGKLRASYRVLKDPAMASNDEGERSEVRKKLTELVVEKIIAACKEVEKTLVETVIPKTKSVECKVFCHKLVADYLRYRCEVSPEDQRQQLIESAKIHYQKATEFSKDFSPVNISRLGVSLNFSVFYYEIEKNATKAIALAKKTFEDAVKELEELEKESPPTALHDISMILTIINENLSAWRRETNQDTDAEVEDN